MACQHLYFGLSSVAGGVPAPVLWSTDQCCYGRASTSPSTRTEQTGNGRHDERGAMNVHARSHVYECVVNHTSASPPVHVEGRR